LFVPWEADFFIPLEPEDPGNGARLDPGGERIRMRLNKESGRVVDFVVQDETPMVGGTSSHAPVSRSDGSHAPHVDQYDDAEPSDTAAEGPVAENLGLVRRFIDAVFDDPSITDGIPEEANVILLPADDPELAAANRRGGEAMQAAGKAVRFIELPPRRPTD